MIIDVLTVCPEVFASFQESVLIRRAREREILEVRVTDIRDFADGSFRHVDDSVYGGGAGMILKCGPVISALESLRTDLSHTVLFSAAGELYTQKRAREYAGLEHLILIAGHYEGFDARILDEADEQICMGDYILSGGEIPAMAVIDSIVRLLGVIRTESTEEESFENGLLEYPQYTRPYEFRGKKVPDVLLSGDHEKIRRWRLKESLRLTRQKRPDLLEQKELTDEEKDLLEEILNEAE